MKKFLYDAAVFLKLRYRRTFFFYLIVWADNKWNHQKNGPENVYFSDESEAENS